MSLAAPIPRVPRNPHACARALAIPLASIGHSLAVLSCSNPGPGAACDAGFLGPASQAPQLEILLLNPDDSVGTAEDGGTAPMILPPQGGRVIFAGARATGVNACGLSLTGSLRDEASGRVRFDQRTVDLIPTGDGWGASAVGSMPAAPSNFANVPVCPNFWSPSDVAGHAFELQVSIVDREGREAGAAVSVTPECAEPQNVSQCLCICRAGYVLGQPCGDGRTAIADAGEAGEE